MCNDLTDSSTCSPTELFSVYRISTHKPTEKVYYVLCRIHTGIQSMHAVNVSQLHVAEPCGINETEKLDKICYKFYCIDSVIWNF